jgi:hypothetical protein
VEIVLAELPASQLFMPTAAQAAPSKIQLWRELPRPFDTLLLPFERTAILRTNQGLGRTFALREMVHIAPVRIDDSMQMGSALLVHLESVD